MVGAAGFEPTTTSPPGWRSEREASRCHSTRSRQGCPGSGVAWGRTGDGTAVGCQVSLTVIPMTLREADAFVTEHHRHHRKPQGALFAIGLAEGDTVVGVVMVGRPVARMVADGWTCEVTRLATDGSRNACSMLYRAAWRAARAMGYRRLVTYTLPEEGGASLRAAGFKLIGLAGGGSWSVPSRPRVDTHPLQQKLRWELSA
jgi:hypothetical protein